MIYATHSPPVAAPPPIRLAPGRTAPDPPRVSLGDRAMTVALRLRAWKGQRLDRRVTEEVLEERRARRDAGHFEKHLVPASALAGVSRAHSQARALHHALTLPWGEDSVRILAATAYFDYRQAMDTARAACERAHAEFCAAYPGLVAAAPGRLAELFEAGDFPSPATIRERFGFRLVMMPVPDSGDFRVELGDAVERAIRAGIEQDIRQRYADAQRDLWTRLLDAVKHFAGTMHREEKVFRDATLTRLADLARIAPRLSLVPDPRLDALAGEVLAVLDGVQPDDLRTSGTLRRETAARARAAVERIERAMAGAF